MDVVWKMRGRLGESGILLWTLLLLLLLSSGAEFEEVQRMGGAFSLSPPEAGEFLPVADWMGWEKRSLVCPAAPKLCMSVCGGGRAKGWMSD
jgi:hypothetical protein